MNTLIIIVVAALIGKSVSQKESEVVAAAFADPDASHIDLASAHVGDEGAKYIARKMKNNKKITSLNLQNCNIGYDGSSVLAKILNTTVLTSLDLANNKIGSEGIAAILTACKASPIERLGLSETHENWRTIPIPDLLSNTKIKSLELAGNGIEDETAADIVEATKRTRIISLDLSSNEIAARAISSALNNSKIQYLNLAHCGITNEGASALAKVLPNTCIIHLDLNGNEIQTEGAWASAEALPDTLILNLTLQDNPIKDDNLLREVSTVLRTNMLRMNKLYLEFRRLVSVHDGSLEFNHDIARQRCIDFVKRISEKKQGYISYFSRYKDESVTGEQIEEFIRNIEDKLEESIDVWTWLDSMTSKRIAGAFKNPNATAIDLSSMSMRDQGAEDVARRMKNNRNITVLDLWNNLIEYQGASAIADILDTTLIAKLNLERNQFGARGIAVVLNAVKNSTIDFLNLNTNNLDGDWANVSLAEALENSRTSTLYLRFNRLTDDVVVEVGKILSTTKIANLDIGWNEFGVEGVAAILTACKTSAIERLKLQNSANGKWEAIPMADLLDRTRIAELDLKINSIGEEKAAEIIEATKSTPITHLDLSYNDVTGEKISGALNYSNITILHLKSCRIGNEGALELAKVLPNTCIIHLNLDDNFIGNEAASALAKALPDTLITKLTLREDLDITEEIYDRISTALNETRLRIDGLYEELKECLEFVSGMKEQRCVNLIETISEKKQGYIGHFATYDDGRLTKDQIEEFILS